MIPASVGGVAIVVGVLLVWSWRVSFTWRRHATGVNRPPIDVDDVERATATTVAVL